MRNCQICDRVTGKRVIENYYCNQEGMCLFECTQCGHRYVDGLSLSQAFFDNYYLTQYTTDDKPHSDARLNSLADCVKGYRCKLPLDIGGTDMELVKRLQDRGMIAFAAGVGSNNGANHDAVILSHTLEHIYELDAMFERVGEAMKAGGYLFIEVPVHLGYQEPKAYDNHWQHINKFRAGDLERLLTQKGYVVEISEQLPDYREYQVWRIVGWYAGH